MMLGLGRSQTTRLESMEAFCHSDLMGEEDAGPETTTSSGRGPNARNCAHSSPADAASIGPSALDRRTIAVRSSLRRHHISGAQPAVPRRHH